MTEPLLGHALALNNNFIWKSTKNFNQEMMTKIFNIHFGGGFMGFNLQPTCKVDRSKSKI